MANSQLCVDRSMVGSGGNSSISVGGRNASAEGFSISVTTWIDGNLSSSQTMDRSGASPARSTSEPSATLGSPAIKRREVIDLCPARGRRAAFREEAAAVADTP